MDKNIALRKYNEQRGAANQRGIEWQFTFETWCAVWEASGQWERRGTGSDNYVMARFGDKGPYSPSNVKIITKADNNRECRPKGYQYSEEEKAKHRVPKRKVECKKCGKLGTPKPMLKHVAHCAE